MREEQSNAASIEPNSTQTQASYESRSLWRPSRSIEPVTPPSSVCRLQFMTNMGLQPHSTLQIECNMSISPLRNATKNGRSQASSRRA